MVKIFYSLLLSVFFLISCKSVYEKQGDKHLQSGDGLKALQRYALVKSKNKGSKDFPKNQTHAYILGMKQTCDAVGDPEIILTYRERILESLSGINDNTLKQLYIDKAADAAEKLATVQDPRFREVCRRFVEDMNTLNSSSQIMNRMATVIELLEKREDEIKQAQENAPVVGKEALIMHQLGEENPEIQED
ncbi:MAG: hypothetical protein HQK83_16060 [Fibrobacteria bacterium]|nr:hypothetical protein [Fibrobacteria bacterium]